MLPPVAHAGGYLSILGYLYKRWYLEEVKLRELNSTVTTHQAIPYTSNGKDVEPKRSALLAITDRYVQNLDELGYAVCNKNRVLAQKQCSPSEHNPVWGHHKLKA